MRQIAVERRYRLRQALRPVPQSLAGRAHHALPRCGAGGAARSFVRPHSPPRTQWGDDSPHSAPFPATVTITVAATEPRAHHRAHRRRADHRARRQPTGKYKSTPMPASFCGRTWSTMGLQTKRGFPMASQSSQERSLARPRGQSGGAGHVSAVRSPPAALAARRCPMPRGAATPARRCLLQRGAAILLAPPGARARGASVAAAREAPLMRMTLRRGGAAEFRGARALWAATASVWASVFTLGRFSNHF